MVDGRDGEASVENSLLSQVSFCHCLSIVFLLHDLIFNSLQQFHKNNIST